MTRDELVSRLAAGVDAEPEFIEGGVRICHTPFVAPLAWLHRVYPVLRPEDLVDLPAKLGVPSLGDYGRFLADVGNGARLFGMSLYGRIGLVDRSGRGLGQPISIDYGNILERPAGLAEDDLVIGGATGWSARGVFVLHGPGDVSFVHPSDGHDVAAHWGSLGEMLAAEIDRLSTLHDRAGESLVPSSRRMPPGAHRWETKREPGVH